MTPAEKGGGTGKTTACEKLSSASPEMGYYMVGYASSVHPGGLQTGENIMWKTVGVNPKYEVNESGEVRNANTKQVLKLQRNKRNGYLYIYGTDSRIGKRRSYLVHRLVAQAFIPNPDNLPQVNHIDECKTNNRVSNLEWCTNEYNNSVGTVRKRQGEAHRRPVISIKDGIEVKRYKSIGEAAKDIGVDITAVSYAVRGHGRKCRGLEWRYAR